ncbi:hypothetical protein [Sanyastnella coralliicola]|uniref:hypothetical protein n=1 Tax=Sanyastnella coralliicola TaxID=3069118 RepID=UPI0027B985AB|nr:hypothetical protein [Longitalea sp. SCSIO 12813]
MKSLSLTLFAILCAIFTVNAQTPESFKYQTVVRTADGSVVSDQNVSFYLEVHMDGNTWYEETQDVQTNAYGLASFAVGEGDTEDEFDNIDWSIGTATLVVSVDVTGGTDYVEMGTSVLHSVPYALYAKEVENTDDADADPNNEIQTLTLNGSTLSISGGNSVELPEADGASAEEEELAKAWVNVPILGNPNLAFDGFNVTTVSKVSTGVYVITLQPGLFGVATNPAVVCTVNNDLAPGFAIPTFSSAPSQVTVRTYDASGNLSDRGFSLIIHGK